MKRYIGITIGPIYDTIMLTSKPAGMWAGSYLFSYLSRIICEQLISEKDIKPEQFVCPYFEWDSEKKCIEKPVLGVGLFPDRIIFQSDKKVEEYSSFFEKIKYNFGNMFAEAEEEIKQEDREKDIEYLKRYIQIYAVELELDEEDEKDKNPILRLSPYLNCYELQRSFVQNETKNPVIEFFNKDGDANKNIKESPLVMDCVDEQDHCCWDLMKEGRIQNIKDIANPMGESGYKRNNYYAIVQADGDNMGKVLDQLKNLDQIRDFSEVLLRYAVNAVGSIRKYGGVPIYAGGDDLLFIAPLTDLEKKSTIFCLLDEISAQFTEIFKEFLMVKVGKEAYSKIKERPTLSWGIEINYYKYPLYEAFAKAGGLLFEKSKKKTGKNTIALECSKHSGKSFSLTFEQFSDIGEAGVLSGRKAFELFQNLSCMFLEYSGESDRQIEPLQSVAQKLWQFAPLFWEAKDDRELDNLLTNLFHEEIHKEERASVYIKKVGEFYRIIQKTYKEKCTDGKNVEKNQKFQRQCALSMDAAMRMLKLYLETGEE